MTGNIVAAAAMTVLLATAAGAATFSESAATRVDDSGGIVPVPGSGPSIDAFLAGTYTNAGTTPTSEWVWIGDVNNVNAASWQWTFDLTGFDPATASLSGVWAVDNVADAVLNGTQIALTSGFFSFTNLSYSGSAFSGGVNTLVFDARDLGGPAGFRAAVTVTADELVAPPPAIPLPASLPLVLAGLGALGFAARARKRGD